MNEKRYPLIETKWLEEEMGYSGEQLRSHFIREKTGIEVDGLIAFSGPCEVSGASLVDLEDAENGDFIKARSMLHFIAEHFQCSLTESNLRLRLFSALVKDSIEAMGDGLKLRREGDDLFLGERKLTVAITTSTPVSKVFHFGVNIDPSGAPVPAVGLKEIGVDAGELARTVMKGYAAECRSLNLATRKVRGVP